MLKNKKVEYDSDYHYGQIKPFTTMYWMPVSAESPRQTTITYTRERIYDSLTERERLMGEKRNFKDFLAVRSDRIETRPYAKRSSK